MPRIKKIYIYKDSHLPENGWLHACFRCKTITAKHFLFQTFNKNNILYEFYVSTCPLCSRKFKKDPLIYIHFSEACNKYITYYYDDLFTR